MSQDKQILLVGFGNMGQALARGWLAKGHAADAIHVVDPEPGAREVAAKLRLRTSAAIEERSADPDRRIDIVVLAVKPNQLAAVLEKCRAAEWPNRVFLSIAAGKTIQQILHVLGPKAAVVRAMPNTPAAIGQGMTVLTASGTVTSAQRTLCGDLMAAVGAIAWVDDEGQMDAVTAVSGSGPAYVFLLIECLEQAAVDMGLARELAKQLATMTVAGAGAYARSSHETAAQLRQRVTSPGGTTQAALAQLNSAGGLAELIGRAVRAATARSRELSAV
ncbi:MAG TPA: pyrroline-5-carboxylate reductase [Gammaproteobacteria bacterium]|nr:pyrroline-5-carboxylate reductase [Gammaproteobacteria bacterium]